MSPPYTTRGVDDNATALDSDNDLDLTREADAASLLVVAAVDVVFSKRFVRFTSVSNPHKGYKRSEAESIFLAVAFAIVEELGKDVMELEDTFPFTFAAVTDRRLAAFSSVQKLRVPLEYIAA